MNAPYPSHPSTPYPPLIINAALTGQVLTPQRAPHLPVTPDAIARDAEACVAAGASMLHLHARNATGLPDWRASTYARVIAAVRERCPDAVIVASTSGRDEPDLERRADVLTLVGDDRPDMASLTLGSVDFHTGTSVNEPSVIEALAARMQEVGIQPELELFDLGMVHFARRLVARGLLAECPYANLMLGFASGAPADAHALSALVAGLPDGTVWAAGALGTFQRTVGVLACAMGGHVRTGLEDNPDLDPVTREPATNLALVQRTVAAAAALGRPVATASEARDLLGLPRATAAA